MCPYDMDVTKVETIIINSFNITYTRPMLFNPLPQVSFKKKRKFNGEFSKTNEKIR